MTKDEITEMAQHEIKLSPKDMGKIYAQGWKTGYTIGLYSGLAAAVGVVVVFLVKYGDGFMSKWRKREYTSIAITTSSSRWRKIATL